MARTVEELVDLMTKAKSPKQQEMYQKSIDLLIKNAKTESEAEAIKAQAKVLLSKAGMNNAKAAQTRGETKQMFEDGASNRMIAENESAERINQSQIDGEIRKNESDSGILINQVLTNQGVDERITLSRQVGSIVDGTSMFQTEEAGIAALSMVNGAGDRLADTVGRMSQGADDKTSYMMAKLLADSKRHTEMGAHKAVLDGKTLAARTQLAQQIIPEAGRATASVRMGFWNRKQVAQMHEASADLVKTAISNI
jgi:hypothetical protein